MKLRIIMHYAAIFLAIFTIIMAFGYWPRESPRDVTPVRNAVIHHVEDKPTMSETFQFGPEDHPGFNDQTDEPETNRDISGSSKLDGRMNKVLYALMRVESGGRKDVVGDTHLQDKAYGPFQIRRPYLEDVRRIAGKEMEAKWGRTLTLRDMTETNKAIWVVRTYLEHYGRQYSRKTGKTPDVSIYARIHNGGPEGWNRASTNSHCQKVLTMYESLKKFQNS